MIGVQSCLTGSESWSSESFVEKDRPEWHTKTESWLGCANGEGDVCSPEVLTLIEDAQERIDVCLKVHRQLSKVCL